MKLLKRYRYSCSVRRAEAAFKRWARKNGIALHGIHYVITWEDWDDGIGVFLFLETKAQVEALPVGQVDSIKSAFLDFLKRYGFPFEEFPNVVFEIDSDENVRENYEGSYFYRLR